MRLRAQQFIHLAGLTSLETIRQPVALLLAGTSLLLIALLPVLIMHQMGDAQKLVRDSALALHFVGGLLFAGYAACAAVQHELRRGTVSAVLSKPVPRPLFFLAKYAGVALVLLVFSVAAAAATLLAARMVRESYVIDWWAGAPLLVAIGLAIGIALALNYFSRRPFVSTAFVLLAVGVVAALVGSSFFGDAGKRVAFGEVVTWKLVPASVLVTMALLVLAGLGVSLATRLDTVPTLSICSLIFLLGLMSDYLFGRVAGDSRLAAIIYGILPNWQHFWVVDALSGDAGIPWGYVAQVAAYGGFYLAGVLCLGIMSFRSVEIQA